MDYENRLASDLKPGDTAELRRTCKGDDFIVFATASGNHNPMHLHASVSGDPPPAPAMWVGSLISAVLGNILPGAGTRYLDQTLRFLDQAHEGDELVARVCVREVAEDDTVRLDTSVERLDGTVVVKGEARVIAPQRRMRISEADLPGLVVQRHRHFEALIAAAEPLPPLPVAVAVPEEPLALGGVLAARRHTLIEPILVGSSERIRTVAADIGADLGDIEIIDAPNHAQAAAQAVKLVRDGRAAALMKGHLHTDELLHAALDRERGLRAGRRLTHIFVMDVPGLSHPLLVSDAAVNIAPDLATKADIVQNAIDLALSLGVVEPKVGVLSAVETVNPAIASSMDAALLSKMAERGQIVGGIVDGPLAMDNAIDVAAARTKGIVSPVAGKADILVVPDLDAGNMLSKQLTYISKAEGAGLVLGARVPIILTSRADNEKARLASCAVAAVHNARLQNGGRG